MVPMTRNSSCASRSASTPVSRPPVILSLPPSRALRWLREARGSPPGLADSRRRDAARSDAAFGPAAAARHDSKLTEHASMEHALAQRHGDRRGAVGDAELAVDAPRVGLHRLT